MGLFDRIGLGSVGKMLDVGGVVKNVVDSVLPHNLAAIGDLAGALVDFKTGNIAAGVQHTMEALRDLPQAARGPQAGTANGPTNLNRMPPHLEPTPPPLASRQGKAFDWNELLSAIKALTEALKAQKPPAAPAAPNTASASTPAPAATTTAGANTSPAPTAAPHPQGAAVQPRPAPVSQPTGQPTTTTGWINAFTGQPQPRSAGTSGWSGEPVGTPRTSPRSTAAGGSATPAATTNGTPAANTPPAASASTTAANPPASAAKPPAPAASTSAPAATSAGQTITSLEQLNGMSDAAIRDAVIHGRISPEIAKDPNAMMVIQQRMNAITEMNNLMTAMMRAIHDMQMAIIQNIRI
jgi:hypothetical protein